MATAKKTRKPARKAVAAKRGTAKRTTAKRSAAKKAPARAAGAARKATAGKRGTAARKPAATAKRKPAARRTATKPARRPAKKKVAAVPARFGTVSAHLVVKNADEALAFYQRALGAKTLSVMRGPGGRGVMHAEMRIGDTVLMLADEWPGQHTRAPATAGGTTVSLYVYVPNVDALFARAQQAGAEVMYPVADMFWGDRMGSIKDPFGHVWSLSTHKEDVSPAEMRRRGEAFFATMNA